MRIISLQLCPDSTKMKVRKHKQEGGGAVQRKGGVQLKLDSCISDKWCFVIFNSMSCISWNVRGIGGCGKDVAIKKLIGHYNPFFVGLVETKHS